MPTIKVRRGTAEQWAAANPVLASGEPGYETDTQKLKFGNGTEPWSDLPYILDLEDLAEHVATLDQNHTIDGQWDFTQVPTVNGLPIGTSSGDGDYQAVLEALSNKASKYGETYEGEHDFSGATVVGLGASGGGGVAVVRYVASLNAARPDAEVVFWLGFPEQPTNWTGTDFWAPPSDGGFETVEYDEATPNLDAARPVAKMVAWLGFPTQPTNFANGDLWVRPTGA